MRRVSGSLLVLLLVSACTAEKPAPVAHMTQPAGPGNATEAQSPTEPKNATATSETMTIWIDVRTAEEFAQGHIPGSILIPYEIIGNEIAGITRDLNQDIRLYCRSGRRSGVAMDILRGMGYVNAINEGGYEDLLQRKAAGEAIP